MASLHYDTLPLKTDGDEVPLLSKLKAEAKATPRVKLIAFGLAVALAAVAGYAAGSAVTPSSATALKDVGSPKNKLALVSIAPYDCPNNSYNDDYLPDCYDDPNHVKVGIDTLCIDDAKNLNNCPYHDDDKSFWSVYRKVDKSCIEDSSWTSKKFVGCKHIGKMLWNGPREEACESKNADGKYAWEACRHACASCPTKSEQMGELAVCSMSDDKWLHHTKNSMSGMNCDWVAEDPASRCSKSGDTVKTIADVTRNMKVPAWRACGSACGTCYKK
jgi:hypothetical protein